MSNKNRIAAIRARLDAATPGPWSRETNVPSAGTCYFESPNYIEEHGGVWRFGPIVEQGDESAHGDDPRCYSAWDGFDRDGFGAQRAADGELVANAPANIAWLLAQIDRLQAALDAIPDVICGRSNYMPKGGDGE